MAEYGLATISDLPPHRRLRPRAADPPPPRNAPRPSPISAAHIGKRLAGKLHEPFERAGGGRAIRPTSPDSTPLKPGNAERSVMSSQTVGTGPGSSIFLYPPHGLSDIGAPVIAGKNLSVFKTAKRRASDALSARTMIGSGLHFCHMQFDG